MAFHKPAAGDIGSHDDIVQLIEALDGTAGAGEPIAITAVNSATQYALSVKNQDTVNGLVARFLDPSDNAVLTINKTNIILGKSVLITDGLLFDGVDVSAHDHSGSAGAGVNITASGLGTGAVTNTKLGAGAVTADKIATGTITSTQIADSTIGADKLSFDPATQDEFDAHANAANAVHGLGTGCELVGCAQGTRLIELASDSETVNDQLGFTLTVVWDNEFTSILGVVAHVGRDSGSREISRFGAMSISTTGASQTLNTDYGTGSTVFTGYFLGIGT